MRALGDERWHEAQDVRAGAGDDVSALVTSVDDGRRRPAQLQALQEADAALRDDTGVVDFSEAFAQVGADSAHVGQEGRLADALQHRLRHFGDEQAAGKGRAVVAGLDMLGNALADEDGAHRQAASQWFGQRHDVRLNIVLFVGPECARPPEAALHFVEDEGGAMFIARRPQRAQEGRVGGVNAAFALQWLDDDGSGFAG